ncbi:hypothetical protein N7456_010234, partial [Penicillium angulare]
MVSIFQLIGPKPPNVDLSDNITPRDNAVCIAMVTIAVISVMLRFYTRRRLQCVNLEIDDWAVAISLIPLIALLVMTIIGGRYGLGKHIWGGSVDDLVALRKIVFAYIYIYYAVSATLKTSLVLLYRRIFGMKWTMWVCLILSNGYCLVGGIVFLFATTPIKYFWMQSKDPFSGKENFNVYYFFISQVCLNIFADLLTLLVPIPLVWNLQMRKAQKIMISGIFLLALIPLAANIPRLTYMINLLTSVDASWVMSEVFVWSTIEPSIGVLCACLPTLNPMVRLVFKKVFGVESYGPFGSYPHYAGKRSSKSQEFRRFDVENRNESLRKGRQYPDDEIMLTTVASLNEYDAVREDTT